MWMLKNAHIQAIDQSLRLVGLSEPQKTLLLNRFMTVLRDYQRRKIRYSVSFHFLRAMITVGSLIVPALLSVQYTSGNVSLTSANISSEVYWIVWILSLFVTISNGVMSLMKVDKKYFVFHSVFEQLLSEAWQYIELTGRYSGQHTPGVQTATHTNQFTYFCHQIEKIRMKQVEDEYYKVMDHANHANRTTNDSIVPLTPFRGAPGITAAQWEQQQAALHQQQPLPLAPTPSPPSSSPSLIPAPPPSLSPTLALSLALTPTQQIPTVQQEQLPLPQVNGVTPPIQQQTSTALRRYE